MKTKLSLTTTRRSVSGASGPAPTTTEATPGFASRTLIGPSRTTPRRPGSTRKTSGPIATWVWHVGGKRITVWSEKYDNDRAIADYNEAIRLDPKHAGAYHNRANSWAMKKDYDQSIRDYDEAIRLDPKNALGYSNRARDWRQKKDYIKALSDYDEAVRIDPRLAKTFNGRAWFRATCSDAKFRDGKQDATQACELTQFKEASNLGTLAAAHAEAGDFAKAVEWQEKANKLYEDAEDRIKGEARVKLYRDGKPYRDED